MEPDNQHLQAALASLMPDANGNVYYFSDGCTI